MKTYIEPKTLVCKLDITPIICSSNRITANGLDGVDYSNDDATGKDADVKIESLWDEEW